MSFLDKVKNMVNVSEDDYYDELESDDYQGNEPQQEEEYEDPRRPARRARESRGGADNVVNIHTTAQLQVVLAKPESFEEAKSVVDNLNEKRTVVINLESTNRDMARRLVDFFSGAVYANRGTLKRVANNTFIITPYNVDVMGDLLGELENNGVFF